MSANTVGLGLGDDGSGIAALKTVESREIGSGSLSIGSRGSNGGSGAEGKVGEDVVELHVGGGVSARALEFDESVYCGIGLRLLLLRDEFKLFIDGRCCLYLCISQDSILLSNRVIATSTYTEDLQGQSRN